MIAAAMSVTVTDDVADARTRVERRYTTVAALPSYRTMLEREGASSPADIALIGDEDGGSRPDPKSRRDRGHGSRGDGERHRRRGRPHPGSRLGGRSGGAMSDFDDLDFFTDKSLVNDPYPYYDALRTCPVRREPKFGVVMVLGYDELAAVLRDDREDFSLCNVVSGPWPGIPVEGERDDISRSHRAAPRHAAAQRLLRVVRPAEAHRPPFAARPAAHPEATEGERSVSLAARRRAA